MQTTTDRERNAILARALETRAAGWKTVEEEDAIGAGREYAIETVRFMPARRDLPGEARRLQDVTFATPENGARAKARPTMWVLGMCGALAFLGWWLACRR